MVQQLRARVTARHAVQGFFIVVVRLVWSSGSSESSGGTCSSCSWDTLPPASLLQPLMVGGSGNVEDQQMPMWICLQMFANVVQSVLNEEQQEEVLTMPELDDQLGNPVVCWASKSMSALQRMVARVKTDWQEKILFGGEGETLLGERLREVGKG